MEQKIESNVTREQSYDDLKSQLCEPALQVLAAMEASANGQDPDCKKVKRATQEAAIALKGDTRQIITAGLLSCAEGSPTPQDNWSNKALCGAYKSIHDKWWRTLDGKPTSHNPALDAKVNEITIYMEVDKKGYSFNIPYDGKATPDQVCQVLDPLIDKSGIWQLPKIAPKTKWGPTLLSFGVIRLADSAASLESQGVTPGCLLYATHLKKKKVQQLAD